MPHVLPVFRNVRQCTLINHHPKHFPIEGILAEEHWPDIVDNCATEKILINLLLFRTQYLMAANENHDWRMTNERIWKTFSDPQNWQCYSECKPEARRDIRIVFQPARVKLKVNISVTPGKYIHGKPVYAKTKKPEPQKGEIKEVNYVSVTLKWRHGNSVLQRLKNNTLKNIECG